jgi:hypothetical protein
MDLFSRRRYPRLHPDEEMKRLIEDDGLFIFPLKTDTDYDRLCHLRLHQYLVKIHLLFLSNQYSTN